MKLETFKHWPAAAVLVLSALALGPTASASLVTPAAPMPGEDVTFSWSGICTDCVAGETESVTGTLILTDFVADESLSLSNFVSFTYNGSSILDPFTIASSDASGLDGVLTADGTVTTDFQLSFTPAKTTGISPLAVYSFTVLVDGEWDLAGFDEGTNGTFRPASSVPVPATLVLLPFGLAAMRVARRRG
jgi:hypothetical protein